LCTKNHRNPWIFVKAIVKTISGTFYVDPVYFTCILTFTNAIYIYVIN